MKDKNLKGQVFVFIFDPPGYLVAAQARKLGHKKNYLKKFGFTYTHLIAKLYIAPKYNLKSG